MKINDVKVKLSRSSSAVPLAIERRRQSVIEKREFKEKFKLKDLVDENQSYNTTTGKLPVEAALTIMRRIHEETGYPLDTSGHTAYDKLSSIRVDPALDLLKEKTWREFFDSKTKDRTVMTRPGVFFCLISASLASAKWPALYARAI